MANIHTINSEVYKVLSILNDLGRLDGLRQIDGSQHADSSQPIEHVFAVNSGKTDIFTADGKSSRLMGREITDHLSETSAGRSAADTVGHPAADPAGYYAVDPAALKDFFAALKPATIRLNHVGIGYDVPNIGNELETYRELIRGTDFKLYEENSGNKYNRWFFIGDNSHWGNALFELVLTERPRKVVDAWTPQFQIDLDTDLSMAELEVLTDKYFGRGFFTWKLDVPNIGVTLAMGKLADVGGIKLFLGLGTDLRGTEWYRQHLLVELN